MFPYISSTFYFICFSLFPLQAGELDLLAAIPVCVLVMYQTLLTVHLHANFFPEASMLNTEQCIIKIHTITPTFHRWIPADFFCWSSNSFSIKTGFAPRCSWNSRCFQQQIAGKKERDQWKHCSQSSLAGATNSIWWTTLLRILTFSMASTVDKPQS